MHRREIAEVGSGGASRRRGMDARREDDPPRRWASPGACVPGDGETRMRSRATSTRSAISRVLARTAGWTRRIARGVGAARFRGTRHPVGTGAQTLEKT
mmetsp:Transcript_9650/g.39525  ORF Transcript_9650/g.39525 Transcript_9650/m.39525 type:complete len:99 (+) Transcript_9650:455-751(+)